MRIVFFGSGGFALPTLGWLAGSEHDVALVVTQPARPSGRGRRTGATEAGATAGELGLPAFEVEDVNNPAAVERIRSAGGSLGVVVAFGQKLNAAVRQTTPAGCVNLHASLLPKYRGAAPIQWAIVRGEQETGCTVFQLIDRMDAGPILLNRPVPIGADETAGELHDRLALVGAELVREAIGQYGKDRRPDTRPQDDAQATFAPKLRKQDGFVRFDRSARDVLNHIRGMTPWPGATARFRTRDGRSDDVLLIRARVAGPAGQPGVAPGVVNQRLHVGVANGFVEVNQIQPASGRVMSWKEFINGRHVQPGDAFVTPNV